MDAGENLFPPISAGVSIAEFVMTRQDHGLRKLTATCATRLQKNCKKDEGRPLGADLREQPSNHLTLLWSSAMVVRVEEKPRH